MNRNAFRYTWMLLGLLAAPVVNAQEPVGTRKTVLPSVDAQVQARYVALEARQILVHSPTLAASLLTQASGSPIGAIVGLLADQRNRESWEQMPDDYYRLTIDSGDSLITLDDVPAGSVRRSVQVRRLCHERLANLPRSSLDYYRRRIDAQAAALLDHGRRTRDAEPLRRLVDDFFCSSVGDQALDLLGDLAFERGDFTQARHWWGFLGPTPTPTPHGKELMGSLRFPDPRVDPVRIEAKRILARIFQGRLDEARQELEGFHARHPRARGPLAGRDALYFDTLHQTLVSFAQARNVNNAEAWTTFAGDSTRNRPLTQGLPYHLWEDGPTWSVKLPALTTDGKHRDIVHERIGLNWRLAFHPVVVGEQVLLADHHSVVSYHLTTGKELFRYDLNDMGLRDPGPGIQSANRLPRFSLSVEDGRAYLRLGQQGFRPKRDPDKVETSYLVCLDIREPERRRQRVLWHAAADATASYFEGAPLVRDGRVYIAQARVVDQKVVTAIVCFDQRGKVRWRRDVCECPEFENGQEARHRQHLLTWAGGQIAYCSHAGAVVAVDAWTGQPTWGVRYPSRGVHLPDAQPSPRDLAPCVYADGMVFAAPLDIDRLLCIDAITGLVRWELEGIEVTHILGVSQGRIHVATRAGVQAIGVGTGVAEWAQPTTGRLPSLGRGCIAGSWLYWPTTDAQLPYRALTLRDGQQEKSFDMKSILPEPAVHDPTMLRQLPVGNMAFGHGCLVIAGLDELVVFVPPERQALPEPRPQARIETLYHRARLAADPTTAYRALLEATSTQPEAFAWRRLIEGRLMAQTSTIGLPRPPVDPAVTPEQQTTLAADALKSKRWSEATDRYRRLSVNQPDDPTHLAALARAYEGQRDYRSAWLAWEELVKKFGDRVEPATGRAYRTIRPRADVEPYLGTLAAGQIDAPVLPLVQGWAVQSTSGPAGQILATPGRDDCFFETRPGRVVCRSTADGSIRWACDIDCVPTRVERYRDLVVVIGRDAVVALAVHDGRLTWSMPAASRRWKVGSVAHGVPRLADEAAGFVHAERWDDTLLLLDDGRQFTRVRLDTGAVLWTHALPSASLRPVDGGGFQPYCKRVGAEVLAQTTDGRRAWIGRKTEIIGTPVRAWQQAPTVVGGRAVVAGTGGRVLAYASTSPHALQWTYQAPFASSLTGQPCTLFASESVLLALVPRNDGSEFVRLNPENGRPLWSIPARQLPDGCDADSVALGDLQFYLVSDGRLIARSLNDGSLQWGQALSARKPTDRQASAKDSAGARSWRVRYAKSYLTVHPQEASPGAPFIVGFIDPLDGGWMQRLSFPAGGTVGEVVVTPRQVLVSAHGRIFGFRGLAVE